MTFSTGSGSDPFGVAVGDFNGDGSSTWQSPTPPVQAAAWQSRRIRNHDPFQWFDPRP